MAAEYMAKWGNKGFRINPNQIAPIMDLGTGFARKSDTNNDTSGQPTTNTRGLELQTITLETTYLAGAGVDPRGQIEDWKKQFGQRWPLIINGQQFGPDLLELESVDFSNIMLDNRGRFLRVDASITLVEYVPPTTTVTAKQQSNGTSTSSTGTVGTSSTSGTTAQAMSVAPSSDEKAAKKATLSARRIL